MTLHARCLAGIAGGLVVSASMALHGQSLEIVRTADGSVRGSVADGVASWKGIPFAAPPPARCAGEHRSRPSVDRDTRDD